MAACDGGEERLGDGAEIGIKVDDAELTVEIAATPESRRRGLMHREDLPEDRGMLFVFADSEPRSFWMKDTSIPLSIAYIAEDGTITQVEELEPYSRETVPSRRPVRYALEVNRGTFARHGVGPGDRVRIPRGVEEIAE
ncbi:MAG: DUF192 domain-containing protein [Spirochaetaceae bacterium]